MTDTTDFEAKRDIADIAVERYKQGRLTRRGFIAAMGALGILPALGSKVSAQANEIVVVSFFTSKWSQESARIGHAQSCCSSIAQTPSAARKVLKLGLRRLRISPTLVVISCALMKRFTI